MIRVVLILNIYIYTTIFSLEKYAKKEQWKYKLSYSSFLWIETITSMKSKFIHHRDDERRT